MPTTVSLNVVSKFIELLLVQIEADAASSLHLAVQFGGHLVRIPQRLRLAGAVLVPLELGVQVFRLVDDELGRRLL